MPHPLRSFSSSHVVLVYSDVPAFVSCYIWLASRILTLMFLPPCVCPPRRRCCVDIQLHHPCKRHYHQLSPVALSLKPWLRCLPLYLSSAACPQTRLHAAFLARRPFVCPSRSGMPGESSVLRYSYLDSHICFAGSLCTTQKAPAVSRWVSPWPGCASNITHHCA